VGASKQSKPDTSSEVAADTPSSRPMSPMEQINLIQAIEWEKTRELEEPDEKDLEVG